MDLKINYGPWDSNNTKLIRNKIHICFFSVYSNYYKNCLKIR